MSFVFRGIYYYDFREFICINLGLTYLGNKCRYSWFTYVRPFWRKVKLYIKWYKWKVFKEY